MHHQYFKVLDQILDNFAELIRAHYDITDFADPSSATDVCYLICIYMLTAEGNIGGSLCSWSYHARRRNSSYV
jgi:hypothetical protein